MNDRFEATFVIALSREQTWEALTGRDPADPQVPAPAQSSRTAYWLPGFDATGQALEVSPGEQLRVRKDHAPCEGTEILVTLESVESGTRVTVVQSGFGAFFDVALNWLAIGWDLIVRDLILFLERGVRAQRHLNAWGPSLGCELREVPSGLAVTNVYDGNCAARAGLNAGDHVLAIGDVPVVTTRDLSMVMRAFEPGDRIELRWLRGSEAMNGFAVL